MAIENISIEIKSNAEKEVNPLKELRKEINGLKSDLLQLEAGTEEYNKKALELANTQHRLRDINEEARYAAADLGEQLATTNRIATGLASGFSAVQGAVALFGGESEALQKTMVKLQAGIALVQGLQGMEGLMRDLEIAKIQFRGALTGVKGFIAGLSGMKKALISTGIGALVVAVGLLIANWDKISKMMENINPQKKAAKAARELNLEITKLANQSAGDKIAKVKELSLAYSQLGDNLNAKKQFVIDYKDELANMGIEMNNVNDADEIFVKNTGAYITALMARAKADALRQKATEDYKKGLDIIAEAEKKAVEAAQNAVGGINGGPIDKIKMIFGIYNLSTVKDDFTEAKRLMDDNFKNLFEQAAKYDAEADKLLAPRKKSGGKGGSGKGSGSSKGKTPFEEALDWVNDALKAQEEALLTEEELLDKKYAELLEKLKGNQEAQLLATEWYINEQTKLVEKELDAQIELNNRIAENNRKASEERIKQADENYQKEVEASEKRLSAKLTASEKAQEMQLYTVERNSGGEEWSKTTPWSDFTNEMEKINKVKDIINQTMNEQVAAIDAEMAKFAEGTTRYAELEQQKIQIKADTNRALLELDDQYSKQQKQKTQAIASFTVSAFTSALSSASSIISAMQEGIDTTTKEGFERNKKLQIANATIQMLMGITSALSGAFTTKTGPWDLVLAGIQAATIAATGGIQIANIKKQTFEGSESSSIPNVSANILPTQTVGTTLASQSEIELQNSKDVKVYVVESEITEKHNDVKTKVEESTF